MGYTSAEGLILTGQGSTSDVTIKNDADTAVIKIATGATGVEIVGALTLGTDLSVANGGTGASTFTANNVLLGNGTSSFQVIAPGTDGQVLTSTGSTWQSEAVAAGGKVVAYSYAGVTTDASTTATFPDDDTIPQSDEGTEYTTVTHTPAEASNKILVTVVAPPSIADATINVVIGLWKNDDADCVWCTHSEEHDNGPMNMALQYLDTAADTDEITYKNTYGSCGNTGTVYLGSQHHGGARYGNTMGMSIQITEFD
jgi:hypothetical protein